MSWAGWFVGLGLVLLPVQVHGASYEYDQLGRVVQVSYDSGAIVTYEYDRSGNITRMTSGIAPLDLAIGVHQNPYLTQFVDVYLAGSRTLEPSTMTMEIGGRGVMPALFDEWEHLWQVRYEIQGAGGSIDIDACATGILGEEACVSAAFGARFITVAAGGTVESPDARLTIRVGQGVLASDGYLLVWPVAEDDPLAGSLGSKVNAAPLLAKAATPALSPVYRVSPAELVDGPVTVAFRYEPLVGSVAVIPERVYIEQLGVGALESVVDPETKTVHAQAASLGDFRVQLGAEATSRIADPKHLVVRQSYPNPFAQQTRIPFAVETRQRARVTVYDVHGRRVARLLDEVVGPGAVQVLWDGVDMRGVPAASGVYFVRIETAHAASTVRLMVLR